MKAADFIKNSEPFLRFLAEWIDGLPELLLIRAIPDPKRAAIFSEDIINGFCHEGPLASPRVRKLIEPIVDLFQRAHAHGVRRFVLSQDSHEPDAVEFAQWPPHCVRGTSEAEAVPAFRALPFFGDMEIIPKNSINAALDTWLPEWLANHADINTFIVVGDCTDLCTYQLAMHLRLDANARQRKHRVILPADCVDTFDLPVEAAKKKDVLPHDGDLLHAVFLYHMALNGIEVVRRIS